MFLRLAVFGFVTLMLTCVSYTGTLLPFAFFHRITLRRLATVFSSSLMMTLPGFGYAFPMVAEAILWVGLAAAVFVGVALIVLDKRVSIQNALSKEANTSGVRNFRAHPNILDAVMSKDTLPLFGFILTTSKGMAWVARNSSQSFCQLRTSLFCTPKVAWIRVSAAVRTALWKQVAWARAR